MGRPVVPSAVIGPGQLPPPGRTLAGLSAAASSVVGSGGLAAFITARTVTVKPGNIDSVPFVIDMTSSDFTADIMRVTAGNSQSAMLINNNGVIFALRGLSVAVLGDANAKITLDQTSGAISLGPGGSTAPDWSISRTAANTASLGTGDRLLGILGGDLADGFAQVVAWGTD